MNRFSVICFLVILGGFLSAGLKAQVTGDKDDQKIDTEVAAFKARIGKEAVGKGIDKEMWVNFRADTFRIQKTLDAHLAEATGRYGESFVWSDAVAAYNELIGHYYDLLMDKMIEIDKKYLQQSQQSWLEFKQSEQILNQIIGRKEYNKSGTVTNESFEYERMLAINKERAVELFHYLMRVNNR